MTRRLLDILISAGGLLLAALLFALGFVLQSQADFAQGYVATQLGEQRINFAPEAALRGEQEAPGGECLVEYAGQPLTTGPQAECYANHFIGYHMRESATQAGFEGATYATLGGVTRDLQAAVAEATEAGTPTAEAEAELAVASELRETMFRGETLRGLLLTVYGFSIFGERAGQAALVAFGLGIVLVLLSIAGFIHAARVPNNKRVL
jgi:hypothetical protein